MNRIMQVGTLLLVLSVSLMAGCHSHTKTVERDRVIIHDDDHGYDHHRHHDWDH